MNTPAPRALVVTVRLLDGRYHGEPEWPPAPARLFQALVAGQTVSSEIATGVAETLRWLESLPAPVIAAPTATVGQTVKLWVPNNDLDAKGGDPAEVASIRTGKMVRPRLFDRETPLVYAWRLAEAVDDEQYSRIRDLVHGLFQLGRGLDMASASAALVDGPALTALVDQHPGQVYRPTHGGTRTAHVLPCPQPGSLDSLVARHEATLGRFQTEGKGRHAQQIFQQPPRPRFLAVAYGAPPHRALFDLRPPGQMAASATTHIVHVGPLTQALRDAAARRLTAALPGRAADVERALIGRPVEGLPPVPPQDRVRLIVLPSIGHRHVDRGTRRLLVEVPAAGPLRADDVFWAFSGLTLQDPAGADLVVTTADDHSMLQHYGVDSPRTSRTWRSVTPVVVPASAARRRIDPSRQAAEAKDAAERGQEEARAERAISQAVRHAHLDTRPDRIRVQREPFEGKGARAERFAPGTRFSKERLWHVEIVFQRPVSGPLTLGDGRFLSLGLMAPVHQDPGVYGFEILSGLQRGARPGDLATALRRAVMSRFQQAIGPKRDLPAFVSGHSKTGQPADERSPHLSFAFDPVGERLLVVPPHSRDHRGLRRRERQALHTLTDCLSGLAELRAGSAGLLSLRATDLCHEQDSLLAPSQRWASRTPYVVNRHSKRVGREEALTTDVQASCQAIGLPTPRVQIVDAHGVPGVGLTARVELHFEVAVPGPMLLGRTRHTGGGLFGHSRGQ